MKFGHYVAIMESVGTVSMKTEEVIKRSEEAQDGDTVKEVPAGLDAETVEETPTETEAEQAIDVESTLNQTADEAQEILQQPQTVDQYLQAADQLDAIQQATQAATEDGSVLTKAAAVSIQSSMESIFRKLDIKPEALPTLEAFKSTWSKDKATTLTLESIFQTGKNLIAKIIESLKAAIDIAANFLAGLFKNRKLMEMRLQSLIKKVSERSNWNPNDKTLNGRYCHGLQFQDKSDASTIFKMIQSSRDLITMFDAGVEVIKNVRDGRAGDNPLLDLAKVGERTLGSLAVDISVSGHAAPMEAYLALPNAMSLAFVEERGSTKILYHTNQNGAANVTSMEAPIPMEISTSLKMALSLIQELRKVEAKSSTMTDYVKGIIRRIEMEYQKFRGTMGNEDYSAKARVNQEARATQEVINKMVTRFPALVFTTVKNVSDWASAGINNLKQA